MDSLETKLVSAKDLIDYCKHYIELYKGTQTDKARRDELYAVIGQIVNMPSEQSDRKRGKWIFDGDCFICSECESAFNWWARSQCSNFCPNCGADMRGEQE